MWSLWRLFNLMVTHILRTVYNTITRAFPALSHQLQIMKLHFYLTSVFSRGNRHGESEDFSSGSVPLREGERERIREGLRF